MWWPIYCEAKASLPVTKLRSPSPKSWTRIASQESGASLALRSSRRHAQRLCVGCSQRVTRWCSPWVSPAQTNRSLPAPNRTAAPGPTASAVQASVRRRMRAMEPPSGEPSVWFSIVRPRPSSCSMANRQPFGRAAISSPAAFLIRSRPSSLSRGVRKVRRLIARSPHPVLLPLGEGTMLHPPSAIQASPLLRIR